MEGGRKKERIRARPGSVFVPSLGLRRGRGKGKKGRDNKKMLPT